MLDPSGRTPLHYAALNDDNSQVVELLTLGESPDVADNNGFVPLHFAAQGYAVDATRLLLEACATVDAVNRFGNTPLFVAVYDSRGRGEVIRMLLEHGADPDHANSSGQSPRGLAALISNYEVSQPFVGS